jgi:hypothetical protein
MSLIIFTHFVSMIWFIVCQIQDSITSDLNWIDLNYLRD